MATCGQTSWSNDQPLSHQFRWASLELTKRASDHMGQHSTRAGKSAADDDAEQMAKALNSRIRLPYLHTPAYPGCCGVHSSARSWITTSIKRGRISKARDGKLSLNPQQSFGEDDLPQLLSDSGSCTFHLKLTDHSIVMLCDAFHTNDFNPVNRISTPPVVYPSQRALHKHSAIFYNFILYGLLNGTNSANGVIGRWRSVLRGYLDILVKIAKYIGIFSECILLSLSERELLELIFPVKLRIALMT
ncbi:predicted protein [Histoplasma capsulatum var. duboisii H88]|uniref:Predicted protein n=1 Tax=Ajellomyces capsulatus (strain H88) TaxID=544711 RepID=F0UF38_AJEC8|nr:predicted protein [Histoplasma capsulatum var. duboisii H88]